MQRGDDFNGAVRGLALSGGVALALGLVLPGAASAQAPASTHNPPAANPADAPAQVEEVLVTARKREERELDVPVAMTALSPKMLATANADDLVKIGSLVPQLSIARGASGNGGSIGIRGVSTAYNDAGVDSPVSISIDGAQFSRNYITQTAALDLSQVEVLKGPQALFFGKNSVAGVVSMVSADPTGEFEGQARVGHEFVGDESFFEGAVGGPVGGAFKVRAAVRYSELKGYFTNRAEPIANPFADAAFAPTYSGPSGRHSPDANTLSGRLTVLYEPVDDFSAKLKLFGSRYRDHDSTGYQQQVYCASGIPTDGGVADPYGDCRPDKYRSSGLPPQQIIAGFPLLKDDGYRTKGDSFLGTLLLTKRLGVFDLTSQTSYFDTAVQTGTCSSYSSFCRFPGSQIEDNTIFEQELRLLTHLDGPVNFMIGAYYEDGDRLDLVHTPALSATSAVMPDPATGQTNLASAHEVTKSKTKSVFAQAIWDITSSLELAAGVRYSDEDKRGDYRNLFVNQAIANAPTVVKPVGQVVYPRFSDSDVSPEVTLTWRPTTTQTLYAAYKTGYKSGGFSAPGILQASMTADFLEFGAEKAKGGEVGYKSELLDRRLRLNTVAYYYKFEGLQRSSLDITTITFAVRNAASAVTKGVEADAVFEATENLSLRLSAAYNDAYYQSFPNASCYKVTVASCLTRMVGANVVRYQDLSGTSISRAPKVVVTGGLDYSVPLSEDYSLRLSGGAKYSSSYLTQEDGNPAGRQGSYYKFDAGVQLTNMPNDWELALLVKNITNKYVVLFTANKPGGVAGDELQGYVDRPREVLLQLTKHF